MMTVQSKRPFSGGAPRRIGLVDDHAVIGAGLRHVLGATADLRLVAAAPTVDALLDRTRDLDLVLLDLSLQDGSTPEQNAARLAEHGLPSLAFTSGENAFLLRSAARGGVLGVARKSAEPADLVRIVRQCLSGDPSVLTTEWAAAVDSDPALSGARLSARQLEVLELFASGEPAKRVAELTGMSQATVNDYLLRIRAKYAGQGRDATNRIALYQRAVEDGVLPPPQRNG